MGRWNPPQLRWNPYSRKIMGRWKPSVIFWNLGCVSLERFSRKKCSAEIPSVLRWNPYSRKIMGRWNPPVIFWILGVRRWNVSPAKNAALESLRVSLES